VAERGEHRMVFDTRGRRKRVIQIVYAGLALVMVLSLFTVVGPVSFTDLFGGGSSSSSSSSIFDDQVQRLEKKLHKNPDDQQTLAALVRARYNAANAQIERDPSTGQVTGISEDGIAEFGQAGKAWEQYLKTNPKPPSASAAQFAAQAYFYAAATGTVLEFKDNIKNAAKAQAVLAEARPTLNSYVTLARYQAFAGDAAGAKQSGAKAVSLAPKAQQKTVKQVVDQTEKQGAALQKQIKQQSKFNPSGGGKQALQNPLGGLSGGGSGLSGGGTTAP
jgi:hypothetical protein